jgi:phenylacetate-CoA ligase
MSAVPILPGGPARGLYARIASGLLFPLHERLKRHTTVRVRDWLEQTQHYPRARLDELRAQRLRELLQRAAVQVPYYAALFAERDIDPATIRSPADLVRVPLLTKPLIRAAGERLIARDAVRLESASTSGSTGEPLKFKLGMARVSHDVAAKWRATRWWGVDIGDPEVVVWSSPIEAGTQDLVRRLRDTLLRSTFIDAKDLSDSGVEAILARIEHVSPRMLFGYTSAVARVADHAARKGRRVRCPNLRVVFVTSAKLLDEQRAQIRAVFGAPVANGYGGRDAGFIAHECPHGGMHITEEDIIVEIVDDAGAPVPEGHSGEVVVTHLASGDFPFIRYRTGDRAALSPRACACGRALKLISQIEGRTNDLLLGPGGRVMHHTGISNLLKDLPGLQNYKVVQEREDFIRVMVITAEPLSERHQNLVRASLGAQLGEGLEVVVERVTEIPLERSGKHRYIVNRVLEGKAA